MVPNDSEYTCFSQYCNQIFLLDKSQRILTYKNRKPRHCARADNFLWLFFVKIFKKPRNVNMGKESDNIEGFISTSSGIFHWNWVGMHLILDINTYYSPHCSLPVLITAQTRKIFNKQIVSFYQRTWMFLCFPII